MSNINSTSVPLAGQSNGLTDDSERNNEEADNLIDEILSQLVRLRWLKRLKLCPMEPLKSPNHCLYCKNHKAATKWTFGTTRDPHLSEFKEWAKWALKKIERLLQKK